MSSSASARLNEPVITTLIQIYGKGAERYWRPERLFRLVGPNAAIDLAHSKLYKTDKLCELLKENFCDNTNKLQHHCIQTF